jgi:hypothetical protein
VQQRRSEANLGYGLRVKFICGGYYLTKRGPRERAFRPQGGFVTISPEQVQFFPDTWAISWAKESDEDRVGIKAGNAEPGMLACFPTTLRQDGPPGY